MGLLVDSDVSPGINVRRSPLNVSIPVLRRFFGILAILVLSPLMSLAQTTCAGGTTFPINYFPKYQVLGVVYAPPGSASTVTYGNGTVVGSSNSILTSSTQQNVQYTTTTSGFSIFGLGSSTTQTTETGWATSTQGTSSVSMQSSENSSIATAGPVSSALGVDHDNDVIYIWLNPVVDTCVTMTTSGSGSSQTFAATTLQQTGLQYSSCDLTDQINDPINFMQTLKGCDPNQYPFPDIVGIPVWCLKNPYYPGTSCAQWQPYVSRSWDYSAWGTRSCSHYLQGLYD